MTEKNWDWKKIKEEFEQKSPEYRAETVGTLHSTLLLLDLEALDKGEHGLVEIEDTQRYWRSSLEMLGANFENQEASTLLADYSSLGKREGLDLVWGKTRVDEYRKWIKNYVKTYEETPGNLPLPALKPSGIKTSGMMQFLGEITAYAAGAIIFEVFKTRLETRVYNGKMWQEGKKELRRKIEYKPGKFILPSSVPPGFITQAYGWLDDTKPKT